MIGILGGKYISWLFSNTPKVKESLALAHGGTMKVITSHMHGNYFAYTLPVDKETVDPWTEVEGMVKAGVRQLVSMTFGGSLDDSYGPGNFVVPDQYMDLFGCLDVPKQEVGPVDMTFPFFISFTESLMPVIEENEPLLIEDGTVISTMDHFTPTKAEREMYRKLGGHLVSPRVAAYARAAAHFDVCYMPLVYLAYDANKPLSDKQWDVLKGVDQGTADRYFELSGGIVRDFTREFFCVKHIRPDTVRTIPLPEIVQE